MIRATVAVYPLQQTGYEVLRAAYEAAAASGPTVMTTTISNICPAV